MHFPSDPRLVPTRSPSPSVRGSPTQPIQNQTIQDVVGVPPSLQRSRSLPGQMLSHSSQFRHQNLNQRSPRVDTRIQAIDETTDLYSETCLQPSLAQALGIENQRLLSYASAPRPRSENNEISSVTRNLHDLVIDNDYSLGTRGRRRERQDQQPPSWSSRYSNTTSSPSHRSRHSRSSRTTTNVRECTPPPARAERVRKIEEIEYLIAHGLSSNFYNNVVSWSRTWDRMVVAIDKEVYWWNGRGHVERIDYDSESQSPIACVACSDLQYTAISAMDGTLYVLDESNGRVYSHRFPCALKCIQWMHRRNMFIGGDSKGTIYFGGMSDCSIYVVSELSVSNQQICVNNENREMAVGCNDNRATIWDISSLQAPFRKFTFYHYSAVKGIQYCPWSPSLLATGGGCHDRRIRFWHTSTGSLISKFDSMGQITSILWSQSRKELAITYGFSNLQPPVLISVHRYPDMCMVGEALPKTVFRGLGTAISTNQTKIAVSADDGTIRVFDIWDFRSHTLSNSPSSQSIGAFGSPLIEASEGIDVRYPFIR